MAKIQEMKDHRAKEREAKIMLEIKEAMLLNFTKKPTMIDREDQQDSKTFGQKKNSKSFTQDQHRMTPQGDREMSVDFLEDLEDENANVKKVIKPTTPTIDESILDGFDMRRQNIAELIIKDSESIDLDTESKPVRDAIKTGYGVSYTENIDNGGQANCSLRGQSYYESPNRNMRRDELFKKQDRERGSKATEYLVSRHGDIDSLVTKTHEISLIQSKQSSR